MFTKEFRAECLLTFIGLNVVTLIFASIAEYFSPKSIFKSSTWKQNEKYWNKRAFQAIKGYVYGIPTFWINAVLGAYWNLYCAQTYYHREEFNVGRFLTQIGIYVVLYDTLFYWQHRMWHIKWPINLYKHIHSWHHQYHPVTCYAAQGNHPLESLVIGAIYFIIGIGMSWIFPFDPLSHQIPAVMLAWWGIIVHDGTFFPVHMVHHDKVHYNFAFGYLKFWDVLCDTYQAPSGRKDIDLQATSIKMQ